MKVQFSTKPQLSFTRLPDTTVLKALNVNRILCLGWITLGWWTK